MIRILRLIRIFIHLIKAFYMALRHFSSLRSPRKHFTAKQKMLISNWLKSVLTILGISVYFKANIQAESILVTKSFGVKDKAKIFVANHIFWLDIVVLGYLFLASPVYCQK